MKNMGLKAKILVGVGVPLVLMLMLGLEAITSINSITNSNKWVEHTHNVLAKSASIVGSAVDMETGMRGYLLAGKDDFLNPYKGGEKQTYSKIADLKKTVSDNPKQVARLTEVEKTLKEWQGNVTEPTIALRHTIGDAKTMNDMADLVGEARGKKYFDKFRGQIATFIKRESTLMDKRLKDFDAAFAKLTTLAAAGESDVALLRVMKKNEEWVSHTYKVMAKANDILSAAVDMETGMRGYLLAGKDEFLAPYSSGSKTFFKLTAKMKKTVSDNPAQVKLLNDIEKTITAWKSNVTEPTIQLRRKIGDSKTMDDMADLVGEARGKQYFDKFRQIMGDFSDEESGLMAARQEDNLSTVSNTFRIIVITIIIAVLIGVAMALYISNTVFRQVGCEPAAMEDMARRISEGDMSIDLAEYSNASERTGAFAALGNMVHGLHDMFVDINKHAEDLDNAAADLDTRSHGMSTNAASLSEQSVEVAVGAEQSSANMNTVSSAMEEIGTNMETVAASAEEMSASMGTISAAAEEASTNLSSVASASEQANTSMAQVNEAAERSSQGISTVASAVEEMTASLGEIKHKVEVAETQAQTAGQQAAESVEVMHKLTKSSQEIDKVVNLINSIADQTNMLALNASIEAAGAGEAGKGFAVVADEVKELARQTGDATKMIANQIEDIQDNSQAVSTVIEEVTSLVNRMKEANSDILAAVEEQSTTVDEVARSMSDAASETEEVTRRVGEASSGIEEINRNVQEISSGISEVTRNVSEAAAGTQEMTRNVTETTSASQEVIRNVAQAAGNLSTATEQMVTVKNSAEGVHTDSQSVNQKAGEMKEIAGKLDEMMQRFTLNAETADTDITES